MAAKLTIEQLWKDADFRPNVQQREAILHTDGPLYLPAGPGSGKTRVLLWRALNLIVFGDVKPQDIFLSTFTEKAAGQLKDGIRTLLAGVTAKTGEPYDLSQMYVGTVHSLCQRILRDRRFSPVGARPLAPVLIDELSQYFYLYRRGNWEQIATNAKLSSPNQRINDYFGGGWTSRHTAVSNIIGVFNRFSEECIDPAEALASTNIRELRFFLKLYAGYLAALESRRPALTDFSLLQQHALRIVSKADGRREPFRHVIVDEYQDTNTVQERLFFELAKPHRNICVVGDDDQALYRFRGATVENFVQFPKRCKRVLGVEPRPVVLARNYRSRCQIVDFCKEFIVHPSCGWKPDGAKQSFRVENKNLHASSDDRGPAVIASTPGHPEDVCDEIADLVKVLIDKKKVSDPNQIAFLYPSLGSEQVKRMTAALKARGLEVFAPRAGLFVYVPEVMDILGLFLHIFGRPDRNADARGKYQKFIDDWVAQAYARGKALIKDDPLLERYVHDRRSEIELVERDHARLTSVMERQGWTEDDVYVPKTMEAKLAAATGISDRCRKALTHGRFRRFVEDRIKAEAEGGPPPFRLRYITSRASSLDWNVLDLFYQFCGFKHFRAMFDLAARTPDPDEGPICNLGLASQFLDRFMEEFPGSAMLTGRFLSGDGFVTTFFRIYIYSLYRRGESEYEDSEDPFPKGRIPFITIHQAKGLEFPVVVLGNPRKNLRGPQREEELVRPLLSRHAEPLDKVDLYDVMRMFYVALSRAQNLLVVAHYQGTGQFVNEPFQDMLPNVTRIADLDVDDLPPPPKAKPVLPKTYSYTGDYILYSQCPRQYMVFRKYGFVPSRSQTMFFGSLVHQTLEDLHRHLIAGRSTNAQK